MATLALTGDGARIARLANAVQAAAQEAPSNASITVTLDNVAWSVTAPSGLVLKV
jgi:hypothetical protein